MKSGDCIVILIGGVSHTGKTLLAQRLLEKYHIPYWSIDHLKMGLFRADPSCGFSPCDSTEHIGEKLWPILKSIIMTNIENAQHIIIEGIYLLPHKMTELPQDYLPHIIPFSLGFSPAYIEKYFHSRILFHRCAIETRRHENNETIAQYLAENQKQKALCTHAGVKHFEFHDDYLNEMNAVYDWIEDALSYPQQ